MLSSQGFTTLAYTLNPLADRALLLCMLWGKDPSSCLGMWALICSNTTAVPVYLLKLKTKQLNTECQKYKPDFKCDFGLTLNLRNFFPSEPSSGTQLWGTGSWKTSTPLSPPSCLFHVDIMVGTTQTCAKDKHCLIWYYSWYYLFPHQPSTCLYTPSQENATMEFWCYDFKAILSNSGLFWGCTTWDTALQRFGIKCQTNLRYFHSGMQRPCQPKWQWCF